MLRDQKLSNMSIVVHPSRRFLVQPTRCGALGSGFTRIPNLCSFHSEWLSPHIFTHSGVIWAAWLAGFPKPFARFQEDTRESWSFVSSF